MEMGGMEERGREGGGLEKRGAHHTHWLHE